MPGPRKKRPNLARIPWTSLYGEQLGPVMRGDGMSLVITTGQKPGMTGIIAVAVESPTKAFRKGGAAVLDDHAHHVIGMKFRSPTAAKNAGVKYLRHWLRTGATSTKCDCTDIRKAA